MSVIRKIVVKQQDRQDGPVRWNPIGILIDKEGKTYVKLNSIPVGNWDGFAQVFTDTDKEGGAGAKREERKTGRAAAQEATGGTPDDGGGIEEKPPF